jgi:hypothetical protein
MSAHHARGEIAKLATLLGVDESELAFLAGADADTIAKLRRAATDRLFEDSRHLAQRLAAAGSLLPVSLIVLLSRRVFGAKLAARVAGEMKAGKAVDVALKLPVEFLADIARELDPRRARPILLQLPADTVRDIAVELLRRGEHVTLGRFVDDVSPAALRASIDAIDPANLLRVASLVESRHRLDDIIDMLPDAKLRDMFAAAQTPELIEEAAALLADVGEKQRQRLARVAGG